MKTNFLSVFVLLTLLAGAARADVATYQITRTGRPPSLDGVLEDKCWENALVLGRFRTLTLDTPGQAIPPTTAMLCYDEDWLYVAYRCAEPSMDKLLTVCKNHDGPVWRDDCVEIMLNPSGDRTRYFHIVVNAAGVVRDAYWRNPRDEDLSWESGTEAKTRRGESEWTIVGGDVIVRNAEIIRTAIPIKDSILTVLENRMNGSYRSPLLLDDILESFPCLLSDKILGCSSNSDPLLTVRTMTQCNLI